MRYTDAVQRSTIYRDYISNDYQGLPPTLQNLHAELMKQNEPEAKDIALAIELFTASSLNTFAQQTNVDTDNRLERVWKFKMMYYFNKIITQAR